MNEDEKIKRFLGPVLECLITFPLFDDDFCLLVDEGVIKPISPTQCEWTKSKTSLAEYFAWIKPLKVYVSGGFWSPIERTFNIKRGTLRKLAGSNGNIFKPEQSRDFIKIKELVLQHREEADVISERTAFNEIKKLVNGIEQDEAEKIHIALTQIQGMFPKIRTKKQQMISS